MNETPEHRTGFMTRSGDSHVIGSEDHAEAVNIDQAAREVAAAVVAQPSPTRTNRKRSKAAKARPPVVATEVEKAAEIPPVDAPKTDDSTAA